MAVAIWLYRYGDMRGEINLRESLKLTEMVRFFKINTDIFLRSLCLLAVFSFIPYISASMGDEILAANTLLMQLFMLLSYIMDGFAYAGESLTGRYVGARDGVALRDVVRRLLVWGLGLATLFTLLYALFGRGLLSILTNDKEVVDTAMQYMIWIVMVPFTGFAAFIFDGIYIGATASKAMRDTMFVATAVFFLLYYVLHQMFGNHGLWLAFIVFLILRGALMFMFREKYILTVDS
jgi:MATE family multidrug resistance protein